MHVTLDHPAAPGDRGLGWALRLDCARQLGWARRLGWAGFFFFLGKGLLWLLLPMLWWLLS